MQRVLSSRALVSDPGRGVESIQKLLRTPSAIPSLPEAVNASGMKLIFDLEVIQHSAKNTNQACLKTWTNLFHVFFAADLLSKLFFLSPFPGLPMESCLVAREAETENCG